MQDELDRMLDEGGKDPDSYVSEVMGKKIHGDHNPGDNLPEGGVCMLEETILNGSGVYKFWSCGYEDHAHGKKTHSGKPLD